jgi:hypothetical protein
MARDDSASGGEDVRQQVVAFIRKAAPFAYCDACLALRLESSLADMAAVLAELVAGRDAVLTRTRRVCYGCGRTLEIGALREGPSR